jgi:hypothetical protein
MAVVLAFGAERKADDKGDEYPDGEVVVAGERRA